jgi:hypothetical protein
MQPRIRVARDGVVIGLIAYAAVALFYFVFDQLAARGPLYTVNLLGRALFRGLRDPAVLLLPVQLDLAAIALYNALHLVLSLAIGLTVVALAARAERVAAQAPTMLFVIAAGFFVTIVGVGYLTEAVRPVLPWWSIVTANTLSVLLAGTYMLRRHPHLLQVFVAGEEEAVAAEPTH